MPNLSIDPDWPQSSTSTVNDSLVGPVDRMTVAMPMIVACVFIPHIPVPMTSLLKDVAFMRTPAALSLYSRFPVGVPPPVPCCTTRPKLACDGGWAKLETRAGRDKSTPSIAKTGSPSTWPPPVTFPGVEGTPPRQFPVGAGAMSQGVKSTFVLTLSPVPGPTGPGPLASPHQLQVASRVPLWPFLAPNTVLRVMLFRLTWISSPVTSQDVISLVFTPSALFEIVLFVI